MSPSTRHAFILLRSSSSAFKCFHWCLLKTLSLLLPVNYCFTDFLFVFLRVVAVHHSSAQLVLLALTALMFPYQFSLRLKICTDLSSASSLLVTESAKVASEVSRLVKFRSRKAKVQP